MMSGALAAIGLDDRAVVPGALSIAASVALGYLLAGGDLLGYLLLVVVLGLFVLGLPPTVTVTAAVLSPWVVRLGTTTGVLPRAMDFLDFPLVVFGFAQALIFVGSGRHEIDHRQRRVLVGLALLVGAMTCSWLINPSSPLRLIAGVLLLVQPFLVVATLILAPPSPGARRALLVLVGVILAAQVPFAFAQAAGSTNPDDVKGTLLAANAGHHVMAGGLLIGVLVLVASELPKPFIIAGSMVALWVMLLADGKQVLFAAPVGGLVLVAYLLRGGRSSVPAAMASGAIVGLGALGGLLLFGPLEAVDSFVTNSAETGGGKLALVEALAGEVGAEPLPAILGHGPGETVSRFGYLTSVLVSEGNPTELIGLRPGTRTVELHELTQSSGFIGDSSFSSAQSSLLGVFGDYGMIGLIALATLLIAIWSALWHAPSPLAPAAAGAWMAAIPLALIFDWLEQPPFTLLLGLVTGLALTGNPSTTAEPIGGAAQNGDERTGLPTMVSGR